MSVIDIYQQIKQIQVEFNCSFFEAIEIYRSLGSGK